jgi:excisionase family DNA binding protein
MTRTAIATDAGDDDWLSTADAARLLGVTPRTLYRLIDGEELPAHRFGRVIRIRRGDVERVRNKMSADPPKGIAKEAPAADTNDRDDAVWHTDEEHKRLLRALGRDHSIADLYPGHVMSVHAHGDERPRRPRTREEYLAWDVPFPPPEDVVIDELTDEESEAFWKAITEA